MAAAFASTYGVHGRQTAHDAARITAEDLKRLPTVRSLYQNGTSSKKLEKAYKALYRKRRQQAASAKPHPGWHDPAQADVQYGGHRTEARGKIVPTGDDQGKVSDKELLAKVAEAWRRILVLVEPAVLAQIPPPAVRILRAETKFRAHHDPSQRAIFIDHKDTIRVIMHETGHYLELVLPGQVWAAIHGLLYERQAQAEAAAPKVNRWLLPSYDKESDEMRNADEMLYPIIMPATAEYTSSYYASGDTEIMSTAMEFFAQPEKLRELVDKDPQMAAVILSQLIPEEFTHAGLKEKMSSGSEIPAKKAKDKKAPGKEKKPKKKRRGKRKEK
jgi:hypothetical protein